MKMKKWKQDINREKTHEKKLFFCMWKINLIELNGRCGAEGFY